MKRNTVYIFIIVLIICGTAFEVWSKKRAYAEKKEKAMATPLPQGFSEIDTEDRKTSRILSKAIMALAFSGKDFQGDGGISVIKAAIQETEDETKYYFLIVIENNGEIKWLEAIFLQDENGKLSVEKKNYIFKQQRNLSQFCFPNHWYKTDI